LLELPGPEYQGLQVIVAEFGDPAHQHAVIAQREELA